MRFAKITLDGYFNYGNKLQNCALQCFFENLKCGEIDTLWHQYEVGIVPRSVYWSWKESIKSYINWKQFRSRLQENFFGRDAIRQYRFKVFDDAWISTRYDCMDLQQSRLAEQYDYLITGSDQVWNPYFLENPEDMFLTFMPPERRIAYAASFGVSEIPQEWKAKYAKWLSEMHAISVREERGAEIVKELTGRDVPVLVDPTLLLTPEEWNRVAQKPRWLDVEKKYILLYFLSEMPKAVRETVQRLAEEQHLEIIDLMDWRNLDWYTSDPAEFVYLIAHADLIYTDSFHGTVFSIFYNRSFVICDRQIRNKKQGMNSRIDTLLGLFHLEDRFGTEENQYTLSDPFQIRYPDTEEILARERQRSHDYLCEAMGLQK